MVRRIRSYNLCFLGFGNVNRTLVRLFENRANDLRERYGIEFRITGVASRRLGWHARPEGIDVTDALTLGARSREGHDFSRATTNFLRTASAAEDCSRSPRQTANAIHLTLSSIIARIVTHPKMT